MFADGGNTARGSSQRAALGLVKLQYTSPRGRPSARIIAATDAAFSTSTNHGVIEVLELSLPRATSARPLRVLCLGAHCDDIEIGCGGTLLKILSGSTEVEVTWVAFSAEDGRGRELRASAARLLRRAKRWQVVTHQFRNSYFPAQYTELKGAFEPLKRSPAPDIIFTHQRHERHQDHRLVNELTWNAFRNHLILEYEIAKYEGGLTTPNAYVRLSAPLVRRKIATLMACYPSQSTKHWFTEETFRALMRLRGIESGTEWAEGFHVDKWCLA